MKRKIILPLALLLSTAAAVALADEINPVVGKVGDFTLRETDLERIIATQTPQVQKQLQEKPELKNSLVRDILIKKAIAVKARKDGLDKRPEFKEQLAYLIDDFLSREYLVKVVLANLKVSDEEMQKYYKEHEKEFQMTDSVKVRHIFFQSSAKASAEERAKARAKAEDALARLRKGEDFVKLAAELSEDADTAKKGGALGVIAPGKTNSEEFEKTAFSLKSGETSGVVETPFGFHIIRVDEKTDKRTAAFDEAKSYIEAVLKRELEQKKGEEFIVRLMKESGLEVVGEKPTTTTEPVQLPASK